MILSDFDLKWYIESGRLKIKPLFEDSIQQNGIDLHLAREMKIAKGKEIFDLRKEIYSDRWYNSKTSNELIIPPYRKVLCRTIEVIEMPHNLMGFCYLRSTFARIGLSIPPTIVDAGFKGTLTIEIKGSSFPVKVYSGMSLLHLILTKLTAYATSYKGKYQGQFEVKPAITDRIYEVKDGAL